MVNLINLNLCTGTKFENSSISDIVSLDRLKNRLSTPITSYREKIGISVCNNNFEKYWTDLTNELDEVASVIF